MSDIVFIGFLGVKEVDVKHDGRVLERNKGRICALLIKEESRPNGRLCSPPASAGRTRDPMINPADAGL